MTRAGAAALVAESLRRVVDPCSIAAGVPLDLYEMGLVRSVAEVGRHVEVELVLTSPFCSQVGLIVRRIEELAEELGVPVSVKIDAAADWTPDVMSAEARVRLRRLRPLPPRNGRG